MIDTNYAINQLIDFAVIGILILGIWQFRAPRSARFGNLTAAFALLCAFVLVLTRNGIIDTGIVVISLLAGSAAGYAVARVVNMIQIPSMVAFQHGAGGIAAFLISFVELTRGAHELGLMNKISGILGLTIGSLTFSGSMIAAAKLANKMKQTPQILPAHSYLVLMNLLAMLGLGIAALYVPSGIRLYLFLTLIALSAAFGIIFSIRIGGADMPVLISFLNATAGLAAAFCGMIIENKLLIACGATVAASGSILTHVMCKAMNRSLFRVFVPISEKNKSAPASAEENAATDLTGCDPSLDIRQLNPENNFEKAIQIAKGAKKVIIVPGYGMALAQAQFEVVSFAKKMVDMGKDVKFAIHPVAGRMPGHMNVLLAEADIDYDMLVEMDTVNPEFKTTDLTLIVGACDVVNPAAINVEGTPISGMPILHAHESKNVVCCNFDHKPGYSGVKNPLYESNNTVMLTGDAKKTVRQLMENFSGEKPLGEKALTDSSRADRTADAVGALTSAKKVIIIPGYGMALAQAQFKVVELASILEEMGVSVKFAIHPVAGRMPGHMNVLLAEAEVDYENLFEMEMVNPEFAETDVALIFGACDVVNPAAISIEGTPISGMPILMAHEAEKIIICNYDEKPGYSGVENPLYNNKKSILLLGDAKSTANDLIATLKS
jgi:NAD(P) transhydrogenase subunit beta